MKLKLLILVMLGALLGCEALAFYNPNMGRWLNRDPLGESGGENVYGLGRNSPVAGVDVLGTSWYNPYSWIYDPEKPISHPPPDLLDEKSGKVNVGKCQIVIIFGHDQENSWNWNMSDCRYPSGEARLVWF